MKTSAPGVTKFHMVVLMPALLFPLMSLADNYFPAPAFVSLKESNQVVRYPGQVIWQGGPKMLYDSITPDGKTLVVSSPKEGSVYIFDTKTGERLDIIKCGKHAKGVKVSPDGREAYVANEGAASVSVIDLTQRKEVATIQVGEMPHNIRFRADGQIAYVTLQGGAGLGVIDTRQRKMIKVIPTPGIETPHNLDLSRDEKRVFIRDTSGKVGVLDLDSEHMLKIIEVGKGHAGIDVTPDGRYAITGAIADDVVTVIDTQTLKIVKTIKVGFGPHGVRASKNNRWSYVAVTADDQVAVIDNNSFKVVQTFDVASFPFWVAVQGNP
jgi:YVTN family beta-propeller protein